MTSDDVLLRAQLAERLARRAGDMALTGRRSGKVRASTKSTPTDLVTEYDQASERIIVEGITAGFPEDSLVGEEGADTVGTSGVTWHVDPIDGTSNFFYDLPVWAVSIGATDAMGPVLGVVYLPVLGEMFTAMRSRGARLNGADISVSGSRDVSTSLVATGFSYEASERTRHARRVAEIIGQVRDIRRHGAAAADLCMVACGRVDAYFEEGLHSWDLVAGQVIAQEAGALATDWAGGSISPRQVLVSTPDIHGDLVSLLAGKVP